jgi:DNA-binding transcriptional ArsR family regulator
LTTVAVILADPTRRAVLERLGSGSATISELAEPFGMSLTGMKKHIRLLEEAQLVTTEKIGRVRRCIARALRPRGHQHVAAAARPLRAARRTHERRPMNTTTVTTPILVRHTEVPRNG